MQNFLDQLVGMIPPPASPEEVGSEQSWLELEERLGLALPWDYKVVVDTYGTGAWAKFLWMLSPFGTNPHLHLETQVSKILEGERAFRQEFPDESPFALYPEPDGLFPWGITDNGDHLFWLTSGNAESWPIVIWKSRGPEYDRLSLSVSEFLFKWLNADLIVSVFPNYDPFDKVFEQHPIY